MTTSVHAAGRYLRTVRHMRLSQILSRIRLRTFRQVLRLHPSFFEQRSTLPVPTTLAGWPDGFRPLDRDRFDSNERAVEIEQRTFTFLHESFDISDDWQSIDIPQLWRFHLHYWDWSWHLVNHCDGNELTGIVGDLYGDWSQSTTYGRPDAWSPYVVSLRLWTWCGLHAHLNADSAICKQMELEIRRHAGFLRANLETDVGGNHLVKNIKALVGAAVFLGDDELLTRSLDLLRVQLGVQVLSDGGHYELSMSYHAQVLGDLIDICELLRAAHQGVPSFYDETVAKMQVWLGAFVGPDDETPVFNDCFALDEAEIMRLGVVNSNTERLTVLEPSGYVIARPRPDVQVVIDVGRPCPDELPAHAHADCLSFELVIGGDRVIVDAGTSEYGATEQRQFERSTAAHNTVEIDGENQTEVWGAFRAGRRARPTLHFATMVGNTAVIDAHHDGYCWLSGHPVHRRRFEIAHDGMTITDGVSGDGVHTAVSALRFASDPVLLTRRTVACDIKSGGVVLQVQAKTPIAFARSENHARDFGVVHRATVITTSKHDELPIELAWRIKWRPAGRTR